MERIRQARMIVILALVIAGLASLDQMLARVESAEARDSAAHAFQRGQELLTQGKASDAVDELRRAHALDRDNPEYSLGLVTGLTKSGKTSEGDALMNEILDQRPNDGLANLTAARLMIQELKPSEAEAYYHRAIYGNWSRDPAERTRAARLELVNLLLRENARQRLLAELISLEAESGDDEDLRKRVAGLFLEAGSPARAAAVYRELSERRPQDAAVGEAHLDRRGRFALQPVLWRVLQDQEHLRGQRDEEGAGRGFQRV